MGLITVELDTFDTETGARPDWRKWEQDANQGPIELPDDPLALSWASYGVWLKFPDRRWVDLTDVMASPHDHEMANTTREYYLNKLTLQGLSGHPMSDYQRDLYSCLLGEQQFTKRHIGMILKLPYFYVEDIARDALPGKFTSQPDVRSQRPLLLQESTVRELVGVQHIFKTRRGGEIDEYWFRDQYGEPVCWMSPSNNQFRTLIKSLYQRHTEGNPPLLLSAYWYAKESVKYNFTHWQIAKAEIV